MAEPPHAAPSLIVLIPPSRALSLAAVLALSACADGPKPSTLEPGAPSSLVLQTAREGLGFPGQTVQISALAGYFDRAPEDVTNQVTWSSSAPGVANVSGSGLVTAAGNGATQVAASYRGLSTSATITVGLNDAPGWVFLGGLTADGQTETAVHDMRVDPRDSQLLYVVGDRGVYVSRDRGASWTRSHTLQFSAIGTLALDRVNPDRVYYGAQQTLRRSVDKGATWQIVKEFPDYFRSIEISSRPDRAIFVGLQGPGNAGIFRSIDDGVTWSAHPFPYAVSGITQFIPWDIAEDPADGTLYVPTELHDHPQPYRPPAFRSIDRGVTWQDVTGSIPWHGVKVEFRPGAQDAFFLTEGAGLYRSPDRGASWSRVGDASFALELVIDPNRPSRFFGGEVVFGGRPGGVFVSTDGGATFTPFGLEEKTCGRLALSGDSGVLFAACYGAGVFARRLP